MLGLKGILLQKVALYLVKLVADSKVHVPSLTSQAGAPGCCPCRSAAAIWLKTCSETATLWIRSIFFDFEGTFPSSIA